MSEHIAKIHWERGDQIYSDGKYARKHNISFDGGISFAGAPNEAVKPPLGASDAVDPEELLVAALSSCHVMWFLDFARKAGFVVNSYNDDPVGIMEKTPEGKIAITKITLNPKVEFEGSAPDKATYGELHHKAHDICNIANSIKAHVEVSL